MDHVLFACIHNAGRSQMAAAWMRAAADAARVRVSSAGTRPAAQVHPNVVAVMAEVGINLRLCVPALLTEALAADVSLLVTMGCGETCPAVTGARRMEWALDDPKGMDVEATRAVRDDIRGRVHALALERGWLAAEHTA